MAIQNARKTLDEIMASPDSKLQPAERKVAAAISNAVVAVQMSLQTRTLPSFKGVNYPMRASQSSLAARDAIFSYLGSNGRTISAKELDDFISFTGHFLDEEIVKNLLSYLQAKKFRLERKFVDRMRYSAAIRLPWEGHVHRKDYRGLTYDDIMVGLLLSSMRAGSRVSAVRKWFASSVPRPENVRPGISIPVAVQAARPRQGQQKIRPQKARRL